MRLFLSLVLGLGLFSTKLFAAGGIATGLPGIVSGCAASLPPNLRGIGLPQLVLNFDSSNWQTRNQAQQRFAALLSASQGPGPLTPCDMHNVSEFLNCVFRATNRPGNPFVEASLRVQFTAQSINRLNQSCQAPFPPTEGPVYAQTIVEGHGATCADIRQDRSHSLDNARRDMLNRASPVCPRFHQPAVQVDNLGTQCCCQANNLVVPPARVQQVCVPLAPEDIRPQVQQACLSTGGSDCAYNNCRVEGPFLAPGSYTPRADETVRAIFSHMFEEQNYQFYCVMRTGPVAQSFRDRCNPTHCNEFQGRPSRSCAVRTSLTLEDSIRTTPPKWVCETKHVGNGFLSCDCEGTPAGHTPGPTPAPTTQPAPHTPMPAGRTNNGR